MSNAAGIPDEKDVKECPVEEQITWKEWSEVHLGEG